MPAFRLSRRFAAAAAACVGAVTAAHGYTADAVKDAQMLVDMRRADYDVGALAASDLALARYHLLEMKFRAKQMSFGDYCAQSQEQLRIVAADLKTDKPVEAKKWEGEIAGMKASQPACRRATAAIATLIYGETPVSYSEQALREAAQAIDKAVENYKIGEVSRSDVAHAKQHLLDLQFGARKIPLATYCRSSMPGLQTIQDDVQDEMAVGQRTFGDLVAARREMFRFQALCHEATAARARNWPLCADQPAGGPPDVEIRGCTAVIDSGLETPRRLAVAYLTRGTAYRAKGDLDHAIADFTERLKIVGNDITTLYARATAYRFKPDPERAAADFDTIIRLTSETIVIAPDETDLWRQRANAYRGKDDHEHAAADYGEVIRLEPEDGSAWLARGVEYRAAGNNDRAIEDFGQAIRLSHTNVEAFAQRAGAYHEKGDDERALADYDDVIKLDPEDDAAIRSRGFLHFFLGRYGAAATDLAHLAERHPDDASMAAWLYLARARSDKQAAGPELEARVGKLKPSAWPYPVVEMLLGRRSPEAAITAAGGPDERCEAEFFVGEWQLLHDDAQQAVTALRSAADTCPKAFAEYSGATAELKRLRQ